jgi:outer membrane cobalamin receptor
VRSALVALCALAWLGAAGAQSPARLDAGMSLESALGALDAGGNRIVYSSALVTPEMTLRTAPTQTRLDALLAEILAPWRLRAIRAANGDWLIVAAPRTTPSAAPPPEPAELLTVDVTATRYGLATSAASAVFLDRRGVEQMPHLADDAVRMLKVLPGVSGGDFSAALNIRGGRRDETMLTIDGAEIHDGFHFRDLDGALSVLDTNLVESIDFVTGGMTAGHGDAMSGRVDLRTRRPRDDDEYRSAAGVSFVSAYGRTGGTFADGRGAWLASARRGYLDVIMERVQDDGERITPRYTDVFGSLYYDFSGDTSLAAHVLLDDDELHLVSRADDDLDSAGQGRAGHAWITLDHRFGTSLQSKTLISASSSRQWRKAAGEDEQRSGDVDADFRSRFLDLRSDWDWSPGERQALLFGATVGRARAEYDYSLLGDRVNTAVPGAREDLTRSHDIDVAGSKLGAHAAWRARLVRGLVVEAGARWDEYRYPRGLRFSDVSPRMNAVLGIGGRGELRAAWGVVYQPQGVHELQVEDDLVDFDAPERVAQTVLGYAHRFDEGVSVRIDAYRKQYSRLRPRFENSLDSLQLIPEGAIDRVRIDAPRARATGVELTVRREAERGFAGWASLAIARTEEDEVDDGWTPRLWDQRRSLSAGLSWTGAKWNLNLAGLYHSGTPTTPVGREVIETSAGPLDIIVAGPRNAARLGDYARVDLRANRTVPLRGGRFTYYLEVTNLTNRENPCCVDANYRQEGGDDRPRLYLEQTSWLPMLPSFGFQFEF